MIVKEIEIEENKKIFNKEKEKTPTNNGKIHFIRSNVRVALFI